MEKRRCLIATARVSAMAALVAGLVTSGGVASADTDGAGGIPGNQVRVPLDLPIAITGDAAGVTYQGHHTGRGPGRAPGQVGAPGAAVAPAASSVADFPAPHEHGPARLPATGLPIGLLGALAAGVLAAGLALVTMRRRRSVTVTAVPRIDRTGGRWRSRKRSRSPMTDDRRLSKIRN
ncbi:MAG TPA: LPXTG cell wall anchor domain-containing protein [Streptosporangiaceae bacterium]